MKYQIRVRRVRRVSVAWEAVAIQGLLGVKNGQRVRSQVTAEERAAEKRDEMLMAAIVELLDRKPGLDQLDISSHLGLSLELSAKLCAKLKRQGRIRPA